MLIIQTWQQQQKKNIIYVLSCCIGSDGDDDKMSAFLSYIRSVWFICVTTYELY